MHAAASGGRRARLSPSPLVEGLAQTPLHRILARGRAHLYSDTFWDALEGWAPAQDHGWDEAMLGRLAPLNRTLWAEYQLLLAGHLMVDKGDRAAMASSIEGRYPFLDEAVVDFAARLSPTLKLRGRTNKWILRRVAERALEAPIAQRRKHAFRANPVIHGRARPRWVDQLLSREALDAVGLFDPVRVQRALARRRQRRPSFRGSMLEAGLSGVVSTQLLHHLFCGGQLCELPPWQPPDVTDETPLSASV